MTQNAGIATIVGGAALALLAPTAAPAQDALPLLPLPQSVTRAAGSFTVRDGAGIAATDAGATAAARLLAAHVKAERGLALIPGTTGAIRFVRDAAVAGDEAYRLSVTPQGITIAASGDRGLVGHTPAWVRTLEHTPSLDARPPAQPPAPPGAPGPAPMKWIVMPRAS